MKKDLGLYIHIPFCVKKCAYCDFLSWSGDKEQRVDYVRALEQEILSYKNFAEDYQVSTLYFGGGTPSVLEGELLERIMEAIRRTFQIEEKAEVTLEMNPGTALKEKLELYKKLGINRLSMGIQSVKNENLKLLGRIHTYEDFLESYCMAREAGFDNLSGDLISSLPGQTLAEWKEELEILMETPLEHVSVYQLIIEEGTEFYKKYGECEELLPDEETSREIYLWTGKYLKSRGFEQYEISNYAREGKQSAHNLRYWERKDYLGLGLGGASMIRNMRMSNTRDWDKYMAYCRDPGKIREEVEVLEESGQMEEFMFLGLRKTRGISKKEFRRTFGKDIDLVYEKTLEKYLKNGMLQESGDRIFLSEEGILLSNQVFADFLFDG
ncbi:MAG TPA: radical SAM family heme chaperone HemW [Candidatus Blautia pullistercoris]|uniref:Heme chaperone HemW n=1 Tax=Candidatus Blautia pullistercoris TaxID=2838499 RepID=A0A9D1VP42_9FIRM|nr:radical SAM family heme chaperone HemW [Candidatus Blautia pullistercoris]